MRKHKAMTLRSQTVVILYRHSTRHWIDVLISGKTGNQPLFWRRRYHCHHQILLKCELRDAEGLHREGVSFVEDIIEDADVAGVVEVDTPRLAVYKSTADNN